MQNRTLAAKLLNLAIVAAFAYGYGTRALTDPDLGWHLVGGLWMLDHRQVPWVDFLGVEHRPWIAYSWLPEVVFAAVYRWRGFPGLFVLQLLQLFASALALYLAVGESARRALAGEQRPLIVPLVSILAFLIAMPFLAPVWYLRPQLMSVVFFTVLLRWAESAELSARRTVPLAIVWANVHVLWICVPAVTLLYALFVPDRRIRLQQLLLGAVLCAAGWCSPYGIANYQVLVQYALNHREAYLLIKEFQPLMPEFGFLFWLFAAVGLALAFVLKGMLERGRAAAVIVFVASFLAAASQRKYLPYFGVIAGFMLAGEILPALLRRRSVNRISETLDRPASGTLLGAAAAGLAFMAACTVLFPSEKPVFAFQSELLQLGGDVERSVQAAEAPVSVLNYFDDGGWIALAFYLARPSGSEESRCKTTIDGRTLVMGEQRLRDFRELITGTGNICAVLDRWQPRIAFVSRVSPIARLLTGQDQARTEGQNCLSNWRITAGTPAWVVAARGAG